ncbi:Uncharacterized protein Fot_00917 [Forsythia ovata]|uniref:RNase H type-1 domain-containing protein n=1 Tax=Forsythia ovata TaxID=205694 RepID=A0ABD1X5F5_9LAMI
MERHGWYDVGAINKNEKGGDMVVIFSKSILGIVSTFTITGECMMILEGLKFAREKNLGITIESNRPIKAIIQPDIHTHKGNSDLHLVIAVFVSRVGLLSYMTGN